MVVGDLHLILLHLVCLKMLDVDCEICKYDEWSHLHKAVDSNIHKIIIQQLRL